MQATHIFAKHSYVRGIACPVTISMGSMQSRGSRWLAIRRNAAMGNYGEVDLPGTEIRLCVAETL